MTFEFKPLYYPADAIHVSLDLETADTGPNAAIVQIGAASSTDEVFKCSISLTSNERSGREISRETMDWWDKQDPELRKRVFSGSVTLEAGLDKFLDWCQNLCNGDMNRIFLWCKPLSFDLPILQSAVELYQSWPFNRRNVGDVYTITRTLTSEEQRAVHEVCCMLYPNAKPHDALDDALYQLHMLEAGLANAL